MNLRGDVATSGVRLATRRMAARIIRSLPIIRRYLLASTDYRVLRGVQEARQLSSQCSGWLTGRTAARQDRAFRRLIAAMKEGQSRIDLTIAAEAVMATGIGNARLIEVGCGGGYYAEVLSHLLPGGVQYCGADYSEATIAGAKKHNPSGTFTVADATSLPFADRTFEIVFDAGALMHIMEYEAAIREAARVASGYCIFHSVPVFRNHPTTYLRKYAYGAPVIEVVFCEEELMASCRSAGLRLVRQWRGIPYDVSHAVGHKSCAETYLFAVAEE